MDYFINFLIHTYTGGIIFIIIGVLLTWENYKTRHEESYWYLRGWAGSIGFIVVGILIIIFKIRGEL